MKTKTIKSNRANYGLKRTESIKYIVFHYTGNIRGDSATGNGNYFKNKVVYASAHMFVDSTTVINSVPVDYIAWHCGHDAGGQYYHQSARNSNSIGIEMCVTGTKDGKGKISDNTIANAVEIGRKYARDNSLYWSSIIRHWDVTHKNCPAYLCGSDSRDNKWKAFKRLLFMGFAKDDKVTLIADRTVYKATNTKSEVKCKLAKGKKYLITDLKFTKSYLWGKTSKGWIILVGKKGTYAEVK